MSSAVYAKPDLSRKVRYDKKAQKATTKWEEVYIYESGDNIVDNQTISTPQEEEQQSQCRLAVRKCPVRSSSLLKGLLCSVTLAGIVIMTLYLTVEIKKLNNSYNQLLDKLLAVNNSQLEEMKQLKDKLEGKWCPEGWTRFGCSCYCKFNELKTWSDSRKHCQDKGADLVIINNEDEQEFVAGLSQNEDCWIGLKGEWTQGTYVWNWVDESPLTKTYWHPQFNGSYYKVYCATCCSDQKWKQTNTSIEKKWICEK